MKKVARRSAAKCVLVIDDHPIVLQGFRQLLEPVGVKQILEAGTLEAGFRLYRDHRPDVVILDLAMQKNELSGLSFIHRLRQRDTRTPILVFTMHSDPKIVSRTLKVGATGYVLKDDRYDDLLKAFECVRRGKTYISSELCAEDGSIKERETTNPLRPLTMRELQTLELLAEGMRRGIWHQLAAVRHIEDVVAHDLSSICSALSRWPGMDLWRHLAGRSRVPFWRFLR